MDIKKYVREEKNSTIKDIYKEIQKADCNFSSLVNKWDFYREKYKFKNINLYNLYRFKLEVLLNLLKND